MNERTAYITETFTRFLERFDAPRHLQGDDRSAARKAEQLSLVRSVAKMLPQDDYRDALADLMDVAQGRAKSRFWPTVFDLKNAAGVALSSRGVSSDWKLNPVAINVERVNEGKSVGEEWLFGRKSAQLLRSGASKEKLDELRNSALRGAVEAWGEDAAREWAEGRKAYHEAALADESEERRAYATGQVIGNVARKVSVPQIEWFD